MRQADGGDRAVDGGGGGGHAPTPGGAGGAIVNDKSGFDIGWDDISGLNVEHIFL